MVEVFDFEGHARDEQWLRDKWGVEILYPNVVPGQRYFELRTVRIEEGPCAIVTTVYDEDPGPMEGVLMAFHCPTAPDPPESGEPPYTTPVYEHDWKPNFVFGATSEGGAWGGAMGPGAAVGEGEAGPHWLWPHHPQYLAECAIGLGWRAGTNHRAPRLYFYLVMGEEPDVPPDPDPDPEPPTPPEGDVTLWYVLGFISGLLHTCANMLDKLVEAYGE